MSAATGPYHFAPLFRAGQVVATPGALRTLERAGVSPMDLLARHVFGDFGELCAEDKEANSQAAAFGGRILSSYEVGAGMNATKVWVITESDRHATTFLLPEEY